MHFILYFISFLLLILRFLIELLRVIRIQYNDKKKLYADNVDHVNILIAIIDYDSFPILFVFIDPI